MADPFDRQSDQIWNEFTAFELAGAAGFDSADVEAVRLANLLSLTPVPGSARERARQRVFDSIASQENTMSASNVPI